MENKYLSENLSLKKELKFKEGKFRIIVFSDLHGVVDFDRRVCRDMAAILDKYNPQLVLLNGDIVWRDAATDKETLGGYLREIAGVFESRKIPWAHVFGNHDREKGFENKEQFPVYDAFEYCLSKKGPEGVDGTGNYVLPVKSTDGEKIAFNVWGLDSGSDIDKFLVQYGFNPDKRQICLQDPLHYNQGYDVIRFSQLMWYWQSSVELEEYNGEKIPAMMFFHECIPEYLMTFKNPAWTKYSGIMRETVGCGPLNSGLFSAVVQRGDVKLIVCGHDHINDFCGEVLGVKLSMDAGISYDGYCDEDLRGGRLVEIDEDNPWNFTTTMVRASDCVENYPGTPDRKENNNEQ